VLSDYLSVLCVVGGDAHHEIKITISFFTGPAGVDSPHSGGFYFWQGGAGWHFYAVA
jgi:hypothetical protein